jgi:hypothetical protein
MAPNDTVIDRIITLQEQIVRDATTLEETRAANHVLDNSLANLTINTQGLEVHKLIMKAIATGEQVNDSWSQPCSCENEHVPTNLCCLLSTVLR